MSLRFIFGGSGAGKSTFVYREMVKKAIDHPQKQYIVMVPDQFTMSTQKALCSMHPSGGIMNIDVQSFSRLIHRISDEVGTHPRIQLDDTGKNLVLRKVSLQKEGELVMLGKKLRRPGYIHEVKSMISEFYQYAISPDDLAQMIEAAQDKGSLRGKLQDLKTLYEGFRAYISEKYITTEEALEELCGLIPRSSLLADCEIVFDGFTGFTPVQCKVVYALLQVAARVTITLCADDREDIMIAGNGQKLFALSQQTYSKLCAFADRERIEVEQNVFLSDKPVARYAQEEELAFLESELFRFHGKTYDKCPQHIHIFEAQTLVSEVQQVCLAIRRLIRKEGYCYRDIAVVTGDLERYGHIATREFDRYQIPYFMDQNRSVTYHPMTEYLLGALNLQKNRFSYESVFRFLRCGMTDITMDETDRLERYVRRLGIRGRASYERRFVRGEEAEQMEPIRQKLMEELSPILGRMKRAKDYVTALYRFAVSSRLQAKCMAFSRAFEEEGDLSAAKEYEKIYPACMDLLNQIYELIGEDEVTLDEFIEIFEAGISEIRIGTIPQHVDQVVIGDIQRTRLGNIKALFFIGVNDGVIPGKGGGGGILSDMEREFLLGIGSEMAPTPRQKIFEQRLYLYQNMTRPTKRLYLSYARMDGQGKQILPSYLIHEITGLFPKLSVRVQESVSEEEIWDQIETKQDGLDDFAALMRCFMSGESDADSRKDQKVREALSVLSRAYRGDEQTDQLFRAAASVYEPVRLSQSVAKLLYESNKKGSISRLEQFAACGYAHFLRYGLGITSQKEYEFEAVDFGTVYHAAIDILFNMLRGDGRKLLEVSAQEITQMVEQAVGEIAKSYGDVVLYSSDRNVYRIRQMKQVLVRSMLTLQHQLAKGNFEPAFFEKSFTIKGAFELVGKVDRVDLCKVGDKTYVKVIDYKSGTKSYDESELYYGLSLQLPLYLYAMVRELSEKNKREEVIPAAMLYYGLHNPLIKEEEADSPDSLKEAVYKKMRMDGLTLEEDAVLLRMDGGLETESESDVIKVKKNKNGSYSKTSQIVTRDEMDTCLSYAASKAEMLMKEIMDGDIAVSPVRLEGSQTDSCSYCPYGQICRFDPQIPGYEKKELPKITMDEIKEAMKCN